MFISKFDVSRETLELLNRYVDLIIKWNPKINLVSRSTIEDIWSRHIEDSLQVFFHSNVVGKKWLDIGSGGGLPGIVIAILAKTQNQNFSVELMESDQRKSVFLRTVIRELDLAATVVTARIENAEPSSSDIISARALAELSDLLDYSERHLRTGGFCVFPKGKNWQTELKKAQESWRFQYEVFTSVTDADAVVLKLWEVERV